MHWDKRLDAFGPAKNSDQARRPKVVAETAIQKWMRQNEYLLSKNYRRAVDSDWRKFVNFCASRKVNPLPALPMEVASFVEEMAKIRAPGTVGRYLSSLSVLHVAERFPDPQKTTVVKQAVRRMYLEKGRSQRQARGLTRDLVEKLLAPCGCSLKDLRDKSLLVTAYDTLLRRSELVALTVEDICWDQEGGATVLVRHSKTDPEGTGEVAWLNRDSAALLRCWLRKAAINEGRVFRSVDRHGVPGKGLHASQIPRIYKAMARKAGLDEELIRGLSGHSTRVGAVQDMIAEGIGLPAIMQAGRWKSESMVHRYGRLLTARQNGSAQLARHQER